MLLSDLDLSAAAYGERWTREREMLRLRVEDGLSLVEIAKRIERSPELVRQSINLYLYRTTNDYPRERRAALLQAVDDAARMQRGTNMAVADKALGADILARNEGTDADLVGIGAFVRASRHAAGMTQEDFAKAAGIVRPVLSEFEKGVRALDLPTIRAIAHRVGLTTADLLRGHPPLQTKQHGSVFEPTFDRTLRAARAKRGVTQRTLSDRSGVGRGCIVAYETGKREPNLRPLVRLARGLGMTLPDLLDAARR